MCIMYSDYIPPTLLSLPLPLPLNCFFPTSSPSFTSFPSGTLSLIMVACMSASMDVFDAWAVYQ